MGVLFSPNLRPLLYWVLIQEVNGRSTAKCGEMDAQGKVCLWRLRRQLQPKGAEWKPQLKQWTPKVFKSSGSQIAVCFTLLLALNWLLTLPWSWKPAEQKALAVLVRCSRREWYGIRIIDHDHGIMQMRTSVFSKSWSGHAALLRASSKNLSDHQACGRFMAKVRLLPCQWSMQNALHSICDLLFFPFFRL